MDLNKAQPVYPNLVIINAKNENYSPIELVERYIDCGCLDKYTKNYIVINIALKIGYRVIKDNIHMESILFRICDLTL